MPQEANATDAEPLLRLMEYDRDRDLAGAQSVMGSRGPDDGITSADDTSPRETGPDRLHEAGLRALNYTVAFGVLIVAMPLLLFIAVAIKLDSRGPVLYRQLRVGRNRRQQGLEIIDEGGPCRRADDLGGRPFRLYKFRTMHRDAEAETGPTWSAPGDDRTTRVGRFLRRHRLDELPQLWNVLKGDMAIVGPRPERPLFFRRLREEIGGYARRQHVRPGITGWAQIHRASDRAVGDVERKLRYDLEYVKHRSLGFDALVMLKTPPVMAWPHLLESARDGGGRTLAPHRGRHETLLRGSRRDAAEDAPGRPHGDHEAHLRGPRPNAAKGAPGRPHGVPPRARSPAQDPRPAGAGGRRLVGTVIDITERKHRETDLERLAFEDPMTGLANRRALDEHAEKYLPLAERRGTPLGLLYLDLTRFKAVNDRHGHAAGDAVLVEVARRLEAGARESDVVSRVGGDEFVVLLPEVEDLAAVVTTARRMLGKLNEAPVELEDGRTAVRAEAGIAVYPEHGAGLEELLRAADQAMYRAKKANGESDPAAEEDPETRPAIVTVAGGRPYPRRTTWH